MTAETMPLATAPPVWQNRIVGQREVDPRELLAHPGNWKIHTAIQAQALDETIELVGFLRPVLINVRSGLILDGHLRVSRAIATHQPTIMIDEVDLPLELETVALLTLDPLAELARPDPARVQSAVDLALSQVAQHAQAVRNVLADIAASAAAVVQSSVPRENANPGLDAFTSSLSKPGRPATVKMVIAVQNLEVVEEALRATKIVKREDALLAVCAAYLEMRARDRGQ